MAAPVDATLVTALRDELQRRSGAPVRLIETHISWVLLAGEQAWKLKKPIRNAFLDYSTPDMRRQACDEELRLNRRLAPELYLRVAAITGSAHAPLIDGPGEAIDFAVCMRRFADGALLSEQLAAGTLTPHHIDRLADRLADFHAHAAVAPAGSSWGDGATVRATLQTTLAGLAAAAPAGEQLQVARLAQALRAQLLTLTGAIEARRAAGAVRECHGDLHLANLVCLGDAVTAFDGIEFDPALRWIDTMSDLAFTLMDLHAHGAAPLAHRLLDRYLQAGGDFDGLRVLRWHLAQRAAVRALVERLRPPRVATPYLDAAESLLAGPPLGPRLLVTHGLSGSGKSTVAQALLEATGAVRLRSDVERKRLFGLAPLARSVVAHPAGIYDPEATRRTFARLRNLAAGALAAGWPVIVDAAFLQRAERDDFRRLAAERGLPFTILHCHADDATLHERVAARAARGDDPSEADLEVLAAQQARHRPLDADELGATLALDTGAPRDAKELTRRWAAAGSTPSGR